MIRTIAPHDTLDDAAYALVVSAVDATRRVRRRRSPAFAPHCESGGSFALCRRTHVSYTSRPSNLAHSSGLFDKNLDGPL